MWLTVLGKLKTKQKLWTIGAIDNYSCLLCGTGMESIDHLFFDCVYSSRCLAGISQWLNWRMKAKTVDRILKWIGKAKMTKMHRKISYVTMTALVYNIWKMRNEALWQGKVCIVEKVVQEIKREVKMRIKIVRPKKASRRDIEWIEYICTK